VLSSRRSRRSRRAGWFDYAPVVGELFAVARDEAIAFRHDSIGTEHVLLALISRDDRTGRILRGFGLDLAGVRADVHRFVGGGPDRERAFDADALDAIGIDLQAVRQRVEETFGEGALERASRRRGTCGAAAFGVAPQLKQALERARRDAGNRGTPMSTAHVAVSLREQQDSVAVRIFDEYAIPTECLRTTLSGYLDGSE
jgi:ATP-dependent Clp protease ATP-binding subunit ClpA